MADNWLILIPTDPNWQPEEAVAQRAAEAVAELVPAAEEVDPLVMDEVEFIDAGANFRTVRCAYCGSEVTGWWREAVAAAGRAAFADLGCTMPCCGRGASLNELAYEMPLGFARFAISVAEPGIERLDDAALIRIGEVLGHPVRAIWQRY